MLLLLLSSRKNPAPGRIGLAKKLQENSFFQRMDPSDDDDVAMQLFRRIFFQFMSETSSLIGNSL